MTLLPNEIARRTLREIHFSSEPLPLYLGPIKTQCGDQHDLRVALHLRFAVRAESVDRRAFADLLMRDREVATTQDVEAYLTPFLHSVIENECQKPAATLISEDQRAALLDRVRKALDAAAFDAGLVVLPPFRMEVSSPSLQAEKQAQAERVRAAERAAEQLVQVRHASELMREFAALQGSTSDGKAGRLLEQIAPADRSSVLLATLSARAADSLVTLFAVAGDSLLALPPDAGQPKVATLPTSLGPLRSVRVAMVDAQQRLLIGARSGVWLLDPSNIADAAAYEDRSFQSTLGFNAAVVTDNQNLYATHADAGLVRWQIGNGSAPTQSQAGGGARQLQVLNDGSVVFAMGNSLEMIRNGERISFAANSARPIVALLRDGEALLLVHEDGVVGRFDSAVQKIETIAGVGGSVSGAAILPWVGGARLLLAREAGGIECVGLEDSVVHRYQSPYSGAVRAIAASSSTVMAVTNDRQRILSWNPGEPRAPKVDLNITSIVHHRVADIAVIEAAALTA